MLKEIKVFMLDEEILDDRILQSLQNLAVLLKRELYHKKKNPYVYVIYNVLPLLKLSLSRSR